MKYDLKKLALQKLRKEGFTLTLPRSSRNETKTLFTVTYNRKLPTQMWMNCTSMIVSEVMQNHLNPMNPAVSKLRNDIHTRR